MRRYRLIFGNDNDIILSGSMEAIFMSKILELGKGEELILVNPRTRRGIYKITNLTGDNISVKTIDETVNEYYAIQNVELDVIKSWINLLDFNNNALNSNMTKENWKNFNKILDCFFIKLFGNGYLIDDVIEQEYQCIVKYQK